MADINHIEYPPIPDWQPRVPVARQPDYNVYTYTDLLPTTLITLPTTYTAILTMNWQSDIASISSQISSYMSTTTPYQKNPYATSNPADINSKENHVSGTVIGVVITVSALALMGAFIGVILLLCRQRRKRRRAAAAGPIASRQMTQTSSNTNAAEARPYVREPSSIGSPSTTTSFANQQPPQPPTLLSTTIDSSYFTGLDTSDNTSIADDRRLSAVASPPYTASMALEPPPPYRPRSVVSRENSTRLSAPPPSYGPRLSVRSAHNAAIRSPFDDPEEDGSATGEPPSPIDASNDGHQTRDLEEMSDVSELSYQQEPAETRSTV